MGSGAETLIGVGGEGLKAMLAYLRQCVRLLHWVFFKPSLLRAHINQIAPGYEERLLKADRGWTGQRLASLASVNLREFRENPALRSFALQVLVVIIVTPFVLYGVIGLTITFGGGTFYWQKSWDDVAFGVAFGVVGGVAVGVAVGVAYGVAVGVAVGVALGVAFGVAVGVTFGVAGVVLGVVLVGVAFGVAFGVAVGVAFGVAFGVALGVAGGVKAGVMVGVAFGILVSFIVCVGVFRLPIYLFEIWLMLDDQLMAQPSAKQSLLRSPVFRDEHLSLPQPALATRLLRLLQDDVTEGLIQAAWIAAHPYQNWAAQKALKRFLGEEKVAFFYVLDQLLTAPAPYQPFLFDVYRIRRAFFPYFTTFRMLSELVDLPPEREWISKFVHRATYLLRLRDATPGAYEDFAREYRYLLDIYWDFRDEHAVETEVEAGEVLELYQLSEVVESFKAACPLPYGEEFYQAWRLLAASLSCESLQQIVQLRGEFPSLIALERPLRLPILAVFRCLHDAAIDAASFLTAAHEGTRDKALLGAQGVLEEARKKADQVYEPERTPLLVAIEHWRRMFAVAGGRVAQQREVEVLPNPYVAGRPIRPSDGQLFAGRREEMKQIEEKLQTGVGLVIYGQRRIGKTSILLHLSERLPHDLVPVYLNLQRLMANTTGGFLHAIGREIVKQFNAAALNLPLPAEFDREPYLSFDQLLTEVEAQLQPEQRLLLSFDEFEELEKRVQSGKIEPEIFAYLRGVTQTGSRFALLFAGLHTLEQMTRAYWNPFFQSVQTVKIGYLSELDARQLITDPVEEFPLTYDEEVIDRVATLTNSHPYLMQNFCHNLVNRLNDPLYRSNRATRAAIEAVLDQTLETSGYYFDDYVWGWSSDDERLALVLIAEAGEVATFTAIEKHLGRVAALQATASLKQRDIINESSTGTELIFRFRIPLARLWVLRMHSSARLLLERTTKE